MSRQAGGLAFAAVGALSFLGIVYYLLWTMGQTWEGPSRLPSGPLVCALFWLPGIALLLHRMWRQPPFIGEAM